MIFPISCWLCVGCLSSTGWTTDSDACSIIDLAVLWFWHWLPDCRVCESWRVHAYTSSDLTGTPEKYRTHNYSTLSYRTRNYRIELVKVKNMVDNAIMEHNQSPTRIIEKIGVSRVLFPSFVRNQELWNQRARGYEYLTILSYSSTSVLQLLTTTINLFVVWLLYHVSWSSSPCCIILLLVRQNCC